MANSAPYEVNVTGTDDETFAFSIPFENADGSDFPFDQYTIEYVVSEDGRPVLTLTEGNGITLTPPHVTFKKPGSGSLDKGDYEHGCRVRHLSTGDTFQLFDGSVTIREGNFK